MKIAIFADIHSNYQVFNKAIEDIKEYVNHFVFLGDFVTDGFEGNEVIELVKTLNHDAVSGNRDLIVFDCQDEATLDWTEFPNLASLKFSAGCLHQESLNYLKSLEQLKIKTFMEKKICIFHGTPYNINDTSLVPENEALMDQIIADYDCDIYLFGHTHFSFHKFYRNRHFINPGSLGFNFGIQEKNPHPYKYGILTIEDGVIEFQSINVSYDYDKIYDHYINSDYYNYAKEWCDLLLLGLRDSTNHPVSMLAKVIEKAKVNNIDISRRIPKELFMEVFDEYIEMNRL